MTETVLLGDLRNLPGEENLTVSKPVRIKPLDFKNTSFINSDESFVS